MKGYAETIIPLVSVSQQFGSGTPVGTARENTIYVVAGSIKRIWINHERPPLPKSVGDVYIQFDPSGTAADFGLRIPVMGLLGQAYRYSGSAWVPVDAYIYKNGSWVQFSSAAE